MGFLDQMAKMVALGMAIEMSKDKKGKPDPYKAAGIAAGMGYTAFSDRASLGTMLGSEGAFDDVPPDEGYELLDTKGAISIFMAEKDYRDYEYDEAAGTITIPEVIGDASIELTATPEKYDVTLHLTDLATDFNPAEEKAEYGKPLDITLTPLSDNQLPETVTVTMNGQPAEFTYEDGVIQIEAVTGPVEKTTLGDIEELAALKEKLSGNPDRRGDIAP